MALGLNLISPVGSGAPSTSTGQSNETSKNETTTTSATNNSTAAEQSAGAGQAPEAKPSQTVQSVNTDVAVARTDKSDVGRSAERTEISDAAARKFATKARAESIVAALIDAISAPIEASEFAAVEAAEAELKAGEVQQRAVEQQTNQSESGLSAVRTDN